MVKEKSGEATTIEKGTSSVSSNVTAPVTPVTKESLMADLQTAMAANDWSSVAKIGGIIAKHEVSIKRVEREKLETEVIGLAKDIQVDIETVIDSYIDSPIMAKCAGVWYSWDFGTGVKTIRLLSSAAAKGATKSAGSAGSVGKKFDITTKALVDLYPDVMYKDSGLTAKEYFDANTNGQLRYNLRVVLLKQAGMS